MAGAYQHQLRFKDCLYWANRSIEYGEKHQYLPAVAIGYEFLSETYNLVGKWTDAYENALKNEGIGKRIGSPSRIGWANMAKGWACLKMGRFEDSLIYGNRAIEMADATNESRLRMLAWYNLIQMYIEQGHFSLAESESKKFLAMAGNLNQQWLNLQALHLQAMTMAVSGDLTNALQIMKQFIQGENKFLARSAVMFTGSVYGELLFLTGQLDAAEDHLREMIDVAISTEMSLQEGVGQRILGQVLDAKGQHDAALEAFNKAIVNQEKHGTLPELARSLYHRGRILKEIGDEIPAANDLMEAQSLFEDMSLVPVLYQQAVTIM
jgi:tetratricopeptide (TPR) repeat protein